MTMTPAASARRDGMQDGSRMCVAWHEPHRPLPGLSRALAPPRGRITRSRRGLTAAAAPPARRAGQYARHQVRGRGIGAQQPGSRSPRSRQHDLAKAGGAAAQASRSNAAAARAAVIRRSRAAVVRCL
ncbi:MAG TPA: hypothetical protein VN714_13105 [Trebonia sp.]|nr:hypothetical protein [Trebonia sp.]